MHPSDLLDNADATTQKVKKEKKLFEVGNIKNDNNLNKIIVDEFGK
jgi:hypothetical protein